MGTVMGLIWLAMALLVPIALIYFLMKGMWWQAVVAGVFLLAIAGTIWLVTGLKHG